MAADVEPVSKEQSMSVEVAIRKSLHKPAGELTEADLEKVTGLSLERSGIKDESSADLRESISAFRFPPSDLPYGAAFSH